MEFKSLKNIHKNKDIYVICSGPSLDWVPVNFFDDKITIGINQTYKKLDTTYLVRKDPKFISESLLNKSKILISKHEHGNTAHALNIVEQNKNVFVYDHHKNTGDGPIDFKNFETKMIVSWSTTTTGMHIAAYMGAKNIILVAHDAGTINGKFTFDGYYNSISDTPWRNWDDYKNWLKKIESQTLEVKQFLEEKFNCNILSLNPFINFNLEGNKYEN